MLGSRASDRGEALAGSLDGGLVLSASTARRVETRARPTYSARGKEGRTRQGVRSQHPERQKIPFEVVME